MRSWIGLLIFVSSVAQAKPFYVSTMRDFAVGERPEIEVTYADSERPFDIRILKPRSLDDFVSQQLDIRRAWKQPEIKINSAKYLIDGFNSATFDFDWLRLGLSSAIRETEKAKYGGGTYQTAPTSLEAGPSKLIRSPAGFDVIKEITFLPEAVGARAKFDVPGFEWFSTEWGSGDKVATVRLPVLDPGVYIAQFVQGRVEGQVILVVNDVYASLEQSDSKALYRVATRKGQPVANAKVSARALSGKWIATGKTDSNGVVSLEIGAERDLVTLVESSAGTAIIDSEFLPTTVHSPDVFMLTDRPLYHPTDQLYFKGIARELKRGQSEVLRNPIPVSLRLADANGETAAMSADSPSNAYGTFWGQVSFVDLASGLYQAVSSLSNVSYAGDVRVKEFKKPTLRIEFMQAPESVKPGTTLKVPIKISRYSGEPVGSVEVQADLQRVRFDGPEWIENAGAGETGSTKTYSFDGTQKESILPIPVKTVEKISIDADGNGVVEIDVPADLPGPINYDYKLNLLVSATDQDGPAAGSSHSFLEADKPVLLQARISDSLVQLGAKATYSVRAVSPAGSPAAGISGKILIARTDSNGVEATLAPVTYTTDAKGEWSGALPTDQLGQLEISTYLGEELKKTDSLLIGDEQNAQPILQSSELALVTNRTTYAPGEKAMVLAILPKDWADTATGGKLHYTLAGETILEEKSLDVKGRAVWIPVEMRREYGSAIYLIVTYARPTQGWVERKVSFRIVDPSHVLRVALKPALETAEPGMVQELEVEVLDLNKKGVKAEIAISVVDEALLALQGDFRPHLIDFFYPLGRLNVGSFFSSEFQGYGYGEIVAKLFKSGFTWAATKSSALKQEDTAYWNPSVETDNAGHAKVSFRLPANNTTWKVSAVVVDQEGRFGEGYGSFKAKSETPLYLALPTLMRVADKGLVRLTAKNYTLKPKTFDVDIHFPKEMHSEDVWKFSTNLAPGQSTDKNGTVEALAAGDPKGVLFTTDVNLEGKKLSFQTLERLRSGDFLATLIGKNEGQKIKLALNEKSHVSNVTIQVADGFSGTVAGSLDWLIHYPYGCAEQLTSSTVPNIIFARLLVPEVGLDHKYKVRATWALAMSYHVQKIWISIKRLFSSLSGTIRLSAQQEKLLQQASGFAEAGLVQLHDLQSSDGGFQWFQGMGSSQPMTHLVLFNLLQLEPDDLKTAKFNLEKAFQYLENNSYGETDDDSRLLLAYEKMVLNKMGLLQEQSELPSTKALLESARGKDAFRLGLGLSIAQMVQAKDQSEISGLRKELAKSALEVLQEQMISGNWKSESQKLRLFFTPTVNNALLARAIFAEGQMSSDLRGKFSSALAARFGNDRMYVTFETSQTLLLSRWLVETEIADRSKGKKPDVRGLPEVLSLSSAKIEPSLGGWSVAWENPQKLPAEISIDKDGGSNTRLTAVTETRFADVKAGQAGKVKIERKFYVLKDGHPAAITPSNVQPGDVVYAELSLSGLDPFHYYVAETEVPGGTTWLDEDNRYSSIPAVTTKSNVGMRETKTDVLRLYLAPWSDRAAWSDKSTFVTGGLFRVENAGDFTAGVGRVRDFYSAEQFAQTESAVLHIISAQK